MRRERIRQTENAGQLRAEQTRAKNPEGHLESCTWHGLHLLAWLRWFEKLLQFHHIIGKTIGASIISNSAVTRHRCRAVDPTREGCRGACAKRLSCSFYVRRGERRLHRLALRTSRFRFNDE